MTAPRGFAGTVKRTFARGRCVKIVRVAFDDERRCIFTPNHRGLCCPEPTDREMFHGDYRAGMGHMPPAQRHSATSVEAAQGILPIAGTLRERVLDLLRTRVLTDEDIAGLLDLPQNTARPRRVELARAGLIEDCGTAETASGRRATLWRAKR